MAPVFSDCPLVHSQIKEEQNMSNNMGQTNKKPSWKQLGTLAGVIVDCLASMLNLQQVQYWLGHKDELKKKLAEVFSIIPDVWDEQKQQISKFYLECLNIAVDWNDIVIPAATDDFRRLELILENLTEDEIFDAYANKFGKDKVYKAYTSIRKAIKEQQQRPKGNYAILHCGGIEPDKKHLNKSYDDFYQDTNKYMVPKEGLIAAFRYRFETGNMFDVKGLTRFHALDSDGGVMSMCRDANGRFCMGWYYRGNRDSGCGPRQLFL